ncbi:HD domain-containing protein [Roseibacillus ishigakijimensis]|uniref:HD domain-containing protein n=1 Tax=Roseibacillus ishigakijimensis TaxID=454146 RepID=A0A934RMW7_9BACT|nr:HD domain-containing protein [Roseibacillus ishigakijimensis]MBK1834329.1 HD domain-containing protein [Roseibacillus ishigakijimensis]
MARLSIRELTQQSSESALTAQFSAQLAGRKEKETKSGKPYLEILLADSTGEFTLKAWADHKQFGDLQNLPEGSGLAIDGSFTQNQWGIDASPWSFSLLDDRGMEELLAGDPSLRERQKADYADIERLVGSLSDPRLRALCLHFLKVFGDRFRRTAAARRNHHARRGGLVEHVAQMMRAAAALAEVYPDLNRDLMIAGVLFHDCGKLWENTYPEKGFTQGYHLSGEMLGHIPLGIELTNKLWRDLQESPEYEEWKDLTPSSDLVRLHLLHLIASHHGTHEFGSPTLPRTPEAFALHHIDNLDAKYEMMKDAYAKANQLGNGIFERQFPLPSNLVEPLPPFSLGPH